MKLVDTIICNVLWDSGVKESLPPHVTIDHNNAVHVDQEHSYFQKFVNEEYKDQTYCTYFDTYDQAFYAAWRWYMEKK